MNRGPSFRAHQTYNLPATDYTARSTSARESTGRTEAVSTRYPVECLNWPKRVAKDLKRRLNDADHEIKLSGTQALVAKMFGYQHWHELHLLAGREEPGLHDQDVSEHIVVRRRQRHIQVLTESGVDVEVAIEVVDAVRPTARRGVDSDVNVYDEALGQQDEEAPAIFEFVQYRYPLKYSKRG